MVAKLTSRLLSILFLLFTISGCLRNELPDIPDVGISPDKLNNELEVVAIPRFNTFKIGEPINLLVRLESGIKVETSSDFNARMFVLNTDRSEWQEVQEIPSLGIFESQNIVLSLEDDGVGELSISIYPDVQQKDQPIDLLVVVTGKIYEIGGPNDQKIGAFIVVSLKP